MSTKRKHFSKEFKEQTVALILEGEKSQAQISREIDVNVNTLQNWKKSYQENQSPVNQTSKLLEEENKKLKKELREAKLENEILKKAMGYFSKGVI
jgi:transposase